ncbi:MAG: hypothetical protein JW862_13890 [Anaerolineales bacterium]|nr:hypothetical protein [Anaerolineales bacterium]
MLKRFLANKFQVHLVIFLLMILASLALLLSRAQQTTPWTWVSLMIFALANLWVLFVK